MIKFVTTYFERYDNLFNFVWRLGFMVYGLWFKNNLRPATIDQRPEPIDQRPTTNMRLTTKDQQYETY